jgi:hypothetical protein
MTRKAVLTLLGIAALVALATAPALGQITGGGTEPAAAGEVAPQLPSQQSLQAIMNLRVAQSGAGSGTEPNASELAAAGVAAAFVAVQISLYRTLRRRNAAA